jgi:hemerythrin-like domain-containing protein
LLPVALLMNEHGIIRLMVDSVKKRVEETSNPPKQKLTTEFVDIAVDFFKIYADRCHHGKEENILFRELAKKQISPEHRKMMDELITEHIYARETADALVEANKKYRKGKSEALDEIQDRLKQLVEFYPNHIEKEDTRFFYPSMEYFSEQELDSMVEEFLRFDANVIHIKYIETVENLMLR